MGRSPDPRTLAAVRRVQNGEYPEAVIADMGLPMTTLYGALKRAGHKLDRSAARKRALADPEVRAKMSAARKRAWADPEVRAKMSAASKRALADPEVRAKMSAASKRAWAKKAVLAAGLPLYRAFVDRARALLDEGFDLETAADALLQEALEARRGRAVEAAA